MDVLNHCWKCLFAMSFIGVSFFSSSAQNMWEVSPVSLLAVADKQNPMLDWVIEKEATDVQSTPKLHTYTRLHFRSNPWMDLTAPSDRPRFEHEQFSARFKINQNKSVWKWYQQKPSGRLS